MNTEAKYDVSKSRLFYVEPERIEAMKRDGYMDGKTKFLKIAELTLDMDNYGALVRDYLD